LYDVTSRLLFRKEFTQSLNVDVQTFSKGIYFYELKNKSGIVKKGKLVKE